MMLKSSVLKYLRDNYPSHYSYWIDGKMSDYQHTIEINCDVVYSLFLLNALEDLHSNSILNFIDKLKTVSLVGLTVPDEKSKLNIHNSAYLLGTINILIKNNPRIAESFLDQRIFHQSELINADHLPLYPKKWSHHNWRVSHWIGGAPSILYSLYKLNFIDQSGEQDLKLVLTNCNRYLNNTDGRLKLYKSKIGQTLFRLLYRIKHNPNLGDIGGVVHLHWINYLMNLDFVQGKNLCQDAWKLLASHKPFMEESPYCLDFDIIQLIRVGYERNLLNITPKLLCDRTDKYSFDIIDFMLKQLNSNYKIHKLPGALAAIHECYLLSQPNGIKNEISHRPIDIIREAYWI